MVENEINVTKQFRLIEQETRKAKSEQEPEVDQNTNKMYKRFVVFDRSTYVVDSQDR